MPRTKFEQRIEIGGYYDALTWATKYDKLFIES